MGLFKKKCTYCRNKIDKNKEVKRDVKVPGFTGTHPKHFCNEGHASSYEKEIEEHAKKPKSGGGCCG